MSGDENQRAFRTYIWRIERGGENASDRPRARLVFPLFILSCVVNDVSAFFVWRTTSRSKLFSTGLVRQRARRSGATRHQKLQARAACPFTKSLGSLEQGRPEGKHGPHSAGKSRQGAVGSREPCEPPDFLDAVSLSGSYRSNVSRALNLFSCTKFALFHADDDFPRPSRALTPLKLISILPSSSFPHISPRNPRGISHQSCPRLLLRFFAIRTPLDSLSHILLLAYTTHFVTNNGMLHAAFASLPPSFFPNPSAPRPSVALPNRRDMLTPMIAPLA